MKLQATMYASPMTSIFSMPYSRPRLSMRRNKRSSMEATFAAGMVLLILVKPTTSLKKTETFSRRSSPPHPLQLPSSLVAMLRGKLVRTYSKVSPFSSNTAPYGNTIGKLMEYREFQQGALLLRRRFERGRSHALRYG